MFDRTDHRERIAAVRAGGEFTDLRELRRWARDELALAPTDRSITGYWKRGVADFDEDD